MVLLIHNELNSLSLVKHICVSKLTIIGSNNGLSPGRRQAIIWTIAGIFLIGPMGTNFSKILIEIHTFSFMKMHLKMSSGKWRLFCLCLNMLSVRKNGNDSTKTFKLNNVKKDPAELMAIWWEGFRKCFYWKVWVSHLYAVRINSLWLRDAYIFISKLVCLAPSHYLNQWLLIANWTLRNKLQWNFNKKKKHFSLKKMTFKMSSVKLPPFCLGLNVFINTVSAVALQAEHYNDVIMSMMVFCFKSPASWLFTQPFIQAQIKENIKAPRHWPLCGKFTGDRWIPRTKGQ